MADSKITALTELTAVDDGDVLAVVDDPAGAPATKKISQLNLLQQQCACIYTTGGAGTQTPGTSFVLMDQWATNGLSFGDMTPDQANNKITVTNTGVYLVTASMSFTGTTNSIVSGAIFWNGVEQVVQFSRKLGTGSDIGVIAMVGMIDVTTGATDVDMRVKCDGGADVFVLVEGSLVLVRIAST